MSLLFTMDGDEQQQFLDEYGGDLTIKLTDERSIIPWFPINTEIFTSKGTESFPANVHNQFCEMVRGFESLMNANPDSITPEECVIIAQQIEPAFEEIRRTTLRGIPCGINPDFIEPLQAQLKLIFSPDRLFEIVSKINPNNISYLFKAPYFSNLNTISDIPVSEEANSILVGSKANLPQFRTQAMQLLKPHMRLLRELSSVMLNNPTNLPNLLVQKPEIANSVSILKTFGQDPELLKELYQSFTISSSRLTARDGFLLDINPNSNILVLLHKKGEA